METTQQPKKNKTLLYVGAGLFVAALAGGAYYFFTRPKTGGQNFNDPDDSSSGNNPLPPVYSPPLLPPSGGGSTGDSFPLRRGSRGARVKQLQLALIAKYSSSILPRYGADGDFGSETESALRSKGIPTVISEQDFASYFSTTQPSPATSPEASSTEADDKMATALALACTLRNAPSALKLVQALKSVADYSRVNVVFKTKPVGLMLQRYTIVEACLSFFPESEKVKFRAEFLRMGLKYDSVNQRWSLSGTPMGQRVETKNATKVWNARGSSVELPARMTLGWLVKITEGVAEIFTLNGKKIFAQVNQIRIQP